MRSSRIFTLLALSFTLSLLLSTSNSHLVAAQDARGSSSGVGPSSSEGKTAADFLREGTLSLSSGKISSAITSFDEAIALDPSSYLSYYRRATASLSLGRRASALSDLQATLRLRPEFAQAHLSSANVLIEEGELAKAKESIETFLTLKVNDEKGKESKKRIEAGMKQEGDLRKSWEVAVGKGVNLGKDVKGDKQLQRKAQECIAAATGVLDLCPNHLEARSRRGDCRLALGEVEEAARDWSGVVQLAPSIKLQMRLSSLKYYILADSAASRQAGLAHLKACLTSDPDNQTCARAHRKMRSIEKALKKAENFAEGGAWRPVLSALKGPKVGGPTVIDEVEAAIESDTQPTFSEGEEEGKREEEEALIPPSIKDAVDRSGLLHYLRKLHCRAHTELNEYKKAKSYCEAVLKREAEDPWALVFKGEEALKEERYEEAVRHLSTALEKAGGQEKTIMTKLQKAQGRLKQSNTKDYYKVLGVSRDADQATLKKAYRKLAKEHHPDKGGSAEKMAQINEAFDVLGDSEKRAQFDSGVDPNDPMAGAGGHPGGHGNPFVFQQGSGGGHPFAQFFQQQQQGGGQHFFKQQFTHSGGAGRGQGAGHFPFDL